MSNQDRPALPVHLGIIPDGNRRWAKAHGKTSLEGHKQGFDISKDIFQRGYDLGVPFLTVFAFSVENWNRTREEVGYLMKIYEHWLKHDLKELESKGIRIFVLGRRQGLPTSLVKIIADSEQRTSGNRRGTLGLCLNYGGLQELADAASSLAASGQPGPYTEEQLAAHLYAPDIPPVDLVIRTSGEQRTSGFMLARAAYAELYFTKKYWPEFTPDDLEVALAEYAHRQRRFGA